MQRVIFKEGIQRKFMSLVCKDIIVKDFIKKYKLNIKYSLFKKYKSGYLSLPLNLFKEFCKIRKLNENDFDTEIKNANWGRVKGGKMGILALEKKYPVKIKEWRRLAIINSSHKKTKKIKIPTLNENFAEFIGAYLGDGTLTKYFIRISGDYRYDLSYYAYLDKIIFELFGISSVVYKDKRNNTAYLVIFSKQLCDYLINNFKLKIGHKIRNNNLIPLSIMQDNNLSLACLRGLMDTDGSVSRRGRGGKQFTVTFISHNPNLLNQVKKISDNNFLFSFISERTGTIGTNSKEKIKNYFKVVGSSNLKHIIRFHQRFFFNNIIYRKDVKNYLKQNLYKEMKMPFKIR